MKKKITIKESDLLKLYSLYTDEEVKSYLEKNNIKVIKG
jgi:hypothetical protein